MAARKANTLIVDGFASASDHAKSREDLKLFVQQLQTQADAADCTVFLLTNPTEQKPSSEETMVDGIINLGTAIHEWRSPGNCSSANFAAAAIQRESIPTTSRMTGSRFIRGSKR